jgi:hypothetical protein
MLMAKPGESILFNPQMHPPVPRCSAFRDTSVGSSWLDQVETWLIPIDPPRTV